MLPSLYLISDAERIGEDRFLEVVSVAVGAGLRMVQLREPQWPAERVRRLAERLQVGAPAEFSVILNWRPGRGGRERERLIAPLGLAGVHIGASPPDAIPAVRARLGESALVSYSAHSAAEVSEAFRLGADFVSLSPVFAPLSKPGYLEPRGIRGLERAVGLGAGPVYALGGITVERARAARRAGAVGVAVIGAITDADDPAAATRALLA